ncbi:iron ABC transporter permease [Sporosarcina soli]|uniref:Iron ABC transporter permease n=1 Tax=Sporosarcina soli TaxID=334736 RepID=A0ABW0TJG3_9BACL
MKNDKRKFITIGFLGCLLFILLGTIHVSQGQASAGYFNFWQQLWHDEQQQNFLLHSRLPRFVIGCLAGSSLAVAGMLMQTMTKNPLASASTLGIHSGANFFVVAFAVFFPHLSGKHPLFLAFGGGLIAAMLVWGLVGKTLDPVRVALTGMIVSMLFASFTAALQLLFANEASGLFLWGSGTLLQLDWSGVQFAWPWIGIVLLITLAISRKLDVLLLDEEAAIGIGEKVGLIKLVGWLAAIFLAAITVAVVGPIGFVGIIAPHVVRLLGLRLHFSMILGNIVVGALLLVSADILVRIISQTSELPVGAMTALIGGPWIVYLAMKMGRSVRGKSAPLGGHVLFPKKGAVYGVLLIITICLFFVSLRFGGTEFTPLHLLGQELAHNTYVWNFRVPRILVSFLVGMLMAAGGVLFQSVLRNPLADASVLGVTSGAGMTAMLFMILFPGLAYLFVPIGAVVGAFVVTGLILVCSSRGGFQPVTLLLIGVSISAVCSAIIQILMVKSKLYAAQALTWLSGSTYGSSWDHVWMALVTSLILLPLIYYFSRTYDALIFGEEVAIGFGIHTSRLRLWMIIVGVIISAISVSIVGTIGFIGLLAPHAARRIVGIKHQAVFPVSILLGGMLLLAADFLGRYVLAPNEVPAGLLVSIVGAPYLLYLLKKSGQVKVR